MPAVAPLISYSATDIAQQLCLYTQKLYSNIQLRDLLRRWGNSVMILIEHFNKLAKYIKFTVFANSKKSFEVATKWIEICSIIFENGNMNDTLCICSTLKSIGAKVDKTHMSYKIYDNAVHTVSSDSSYLYLRQAVNKLRGIKPCMPYLGILLTDIVYITDSYPVKTHEWGAFNKMSMVLDTLSTTISVKYTFTENNQIFSAIHDLPSISIASLKPFHEELISLHNPYMLK